jgi:hypothetical protein
MEDVMSRPMNKSQLLAAAHKEEQMLEKLLAGMTPEQLTQAAPPAGWAIKDILAHLYEWHQMFFTWYETGLHGGIPAVPAAGYKWSQLPALNQHIFEKYCQLSPEQTLAMFHESHQKTIRFIEDLPEKDLITPGLYKWMNQNTLMAYLNSITAAHYVWAIKDIRKILQGHET